MKKSHYIFIFLITALSCKQNTTNNTTTAVDDSNPLSIRDHKLGLSPDERFGVLFDSVQMSNIFSDSKTFVDCTPITTTDSIMAAFDLERKKPNFNLQSFINQYFIIPKNAADAYKTDMSNTAGTHITDLWPVLTRTADTADFGTKIPLFKPYIVPGGRFREITGILTLPCWVYKQMVR